MPECDIAIVGGGPGGYVAAIRAAQLGKRVVLVEKERVGGLCLNWGCIPSKALLWNAEVLHLLRDAATYGFSFDNLRVDVGVAIDRSRAVVDQMVKGVEFLLNKHGVRVISGEAAFASPNQLRVRGMDEPIDAAAVVVATGARPRRLPGLEPDGEVVFGSREALALRELPERVVIVGGGPIGVEFAYFWRAYGVDVTVLELLDHLLPLEDEEISVQVERAFKKQGINFFTGAQVAGAEVRNGRATVRFTAKGQEQELDAERVLVGVGFEAAVDALALDRAGVQLERGWIKTDASLQTTAPGVYAVGDVTGIMNLAHVASAQGVMVVERLAGLDSPPLDYRRLPRATYCQPEVGSVGLTEKQAREAGYEVKAGKFPVRANGRAKAVNQPDGLMKIVADAATGETLGIHMVGPMVTELLAEASLGMTLEATPRELGWTVAAHPTLGEAVKEAALAVDGEAIHFWTE
ncbi:MAG TPA: dihydrolipoyl dehydrogenase [Dehalococcoidia bacterium]|nr:dihydrolipoyl dehydrogenase [Dehalococcoidia bacterium]